MSNNPYRGMRKRNVVPIEKWSLFRQAAKACGIAERESKGERGVHDPNRVKALLKRVVGEENLKHVHVKSSSKFGPEFEIDGIGLTYHEGSKDVDDFFTVIVMYEEDGEEEFELEEHRARSLEDLGSILMLYVDILADDNEEYTELLGEMQMSFLGIEDDRDAVEKTIAAQEGEQIEPGQARVTGAAQIPTATMTLGAAISNKKRKKARQP